MFDNRHLDFHSVALDTGREVPEGYPPGIEQRVLAGVLDEGMDHGNHSRLPRFDRDALATKTFVRDHSQELYPLPGGAAVNTEKEPEAFAPNIYTFTSPA